MIGTFIYVNNWSKFATGSSLYAPVLCHSPQRHKNHWKLCLQCQKCYLWNTTLTFLDARHIISTISYWRGRSFYSENSFFPFELSQTWKTWIHVQSGMPIHICLGDQKIVFPLWTFSNMNPGTKRNAHPYLLGRSENSFFPFELSQIWIQVRSGMPIHICLGDQKMALFLLLTFSNIESPIIWVKYQSRYKAEWPSIFAWEIKKLFFPPWEIRKWLFSSF